MNNLILIGQKKEATNSQLLAIVNELFDVPTAPIKLYTVQGGSIANEVESNAKAYFLNLPENKVITPIECSISNKMTSKGHRNVHLQSVIILESPKTR